MFDSNLVRPLLNALTGLILLVWLSMILLGTSAFLFSTGEYQPVNTGWESHNVAAIATPKPATLTEQQVQGQQLFANNCAQCHAISEEVIIGPGLKGITSRTPGEAWLMRWIRNSSVVIASGDIYAIQLYKSFSKIQMPSFPNLTDADIRAILAYVDLKLTATP